MHTFELPSNIKIFHSSPTKGQKLYYMHNKYSTIEFEKTVHFAWIYCRIHSQLNNYRNYYL